MEDITFEKLLLQDSVVNEYTTYTDTSHNDIIKTDVVDPDLTTKLDQMGVFPLLVHIGDQQLEIIHHLKPGITNIITKTQSNAYGIAGLANQGHPIEIRNIQNIPFSTGKIIKIDTVLKATSPEETASVIELKNNNDTYKPFTFAVDPVIRILNSMTSTEWQAKDILNRWIQ